MILFSIPSETLLLTTFERNTQVLEQREDDACIFKGPDSGVKSKSVANEGIDKAAAFPVLFDKQDSLSGTREIGGRRRSGHASPDNDGVVSVFSHPGSFRDLQ